MIAHREGFGALLLVVGLLGCGGTITGSRPDGSTTGACSSLGACECMAANDRCSARTESCYCPTACDPQIACICGGGRFLACEEKATFAACRTELAAVQAKCPIAAPSAAADLSDLCTTGRDPTCVAACLARLNTGGSCAEIDCRFCKLCDCGPPPAPSPFADCLQACAPPLPED